MTLLRHWLTGRRVRKRDGNLYTDDRRQLRSVYGRMSAREFEEVNGPQHWWNERAVPTVLRAQTLAAPWRIVDLGCGSGGSSELLLRHAPDGSSLIGYDLCASLLARARQRPWRRLAPAADVQFVAQSITDRLRDPGGQPLADRSVDVAHAAGIVGHHLDHDDLRALAAELRRVVAPRGIAVLDAGPRMPARTLRATMADAGFEPVARYRLHPFARRVAIAFARFDRAD